MKKQIQLHEIAGYLPYGLMLYKEGFPNTELRMLKVGHDYSYWKPILRPLSDLTKEITHNGKTFTPVYWLEDFYDNLDLHEQAIQLSKDCRWVNQSDYMLIMHLIEWHFDIHNLIGRGLAIDINTLTIQQ